MQHRSYSSLVPIRQREQAESWNGSSAELVRETSGVLTGSGLANHPGDCAPLQGETRTDMSTRTGGSYLSVSCYVHVTD